MCGYILLHPCLLCTFIYIPIRARLPNGGDSGRHSPGIDLRFWQCRHTYSLPGPLHFCTSDGDELVEDTSWSRTKRGPSLAELLRRVEVRSEEPDFVA